MNVCTFAANSMCELHKRLRLFTNKFYKFFLMKSFATPNQWSYTDLFSTGRTMNHKFSLLWLMLFTLLLLPTRMVAQTTTEDSRCALFNDLDGITNVTITDNGDYPWKMLDLNAEGMKNLGFTFPDESKVLMSSNYHVNKSSSETVVNFTVEKPIVLTFKFLVSTDVFDKATVTLDNKEYGNISEKNQIEVKALLPVGEHSLKLSYKKNTSGSSYADRVFIYDLNTATNISDYVAVYDATNQTLTFKKNSSNNLESLDLSRTVIVDNEPTVKNLCSRLGINNNTTIKSVVFDKSFNEYAPTSLEGFFQDCKGLETILGLEYLNTANVTSMYNMFKNCQKLSSLTLSESFNTANVTNMSAMFYGCKNLSSLNLSNFNTANVTNMAYIFTNCNNLSSLTLSNFNTAKVTNMAFMFQDCNKLSSLDLSNFNTANVTNMSNMFYGCNNLSSLDLSNFNTAKVTSMYSMFSGCNNLSSLILSNFNTAKVTNMAFMFQDCNKLSSLDLSNFNTENVTVMYNMFSNCKNLSSLTLSESFNTAKVTNMLFMFSGCNNLSSLDLSNFNTENVTNMESMFKGCSTLQSIYVSDNFVVTAIKYESSKKNLFTDCNALKGALPKYDPTKTSSDYANYKTGYFTKLVGKNGSDKIGAVGEVLTAESIALADDKDLVVYEPFTATAATYNRTINANTTWATLCLPFEVSLDGQNFRAFKLLSADEGTNTVELEELTTSIEAGTPVIIKMNEGANSLKFSVENTAIAKDIQTAATADGNYNLQGIYTQKVFDKDVDNNCYIVKGDKLMNPAKLLANTNVKKVASKPFRAYMVGNSSAPAAGAKMFSIGFNDNTTAIDNLNTIANDKAVYYDIQGLRLNAPQKGINIVKRGNKTMKVIIK